MKTDDFDYYLPEDLIAQTPLENRSESKIKAEFKIGTNLHTKVASAQLQISIFFLSCVCASVSDFTDLCERSFF